MSIESIIEKRVIESSTYNLIISKCVHYSYLLEWVLLGPILFFRRGRRSKSNTYNLIMSIESIIEKRVMKLNTHNLIMSIESIIEKRVIKSSTHNLIMSIESIIEKRVIEWSTYNLIMSKCINYSYLLEWALFGPTWFFCRGRGSNQILII